uniref:Germin-like protein n=1 Tax=Rhizophora mucronata TaxID=61149 RepID=A0A2P2NFF6_RHIMU
MKGARFFATLGLLALASSFASAYDPSPLQDFCIATDGPPGLFVNGKFCKDPKLVTANDFYLAAGLNKPGNTSASKLGFAITRVFIDELPGLNTLGISLARLDWAIGGLHPPHTHPRGTVIIVVTEGTLLAGLVLSDQFNNTLLTKVMHPGDVFVFPIGLIHFQLNIGKVNAVAFAAFSSQNPGDVTVADSVFGAKPHINPEVLTKAFGVNADVVQNLEKVRANKLRN